MHRAVNLLVRLWMAVIVCVKWSYHKVFSKSSKQDLPITSNGWKDDAPQEEWEDWDTMTVTVVPNNPPDDPRIKYSTRPTSNAENEPSAEELFQDMQPVYKKAKMLKVYRSDEQAVTNVDSRKFAIDSSFQPTTVSEELEVWRDEPSDGTWEDDTTFDDNELIKVSREALREKRLVEREQRRQQQEAAARVKQEQSKLTTVKLSSNN